MSSRELSPADHIAQYALLSRLVAAAVALAAAGGFDQLDRGRLGLGVSILVIVSGNYAALRRWPYVVDTIRVRDKPLYLALDIALALSVILTVGAASPLVLYLVGTAVLAGLVYPWRFAVGASVVVTCGYLTVLASGHGAAPGSIDVHSVFTLPALMVGAGPAASAVRRLLRLRDQDAQAVGSLRSQMAVREERLRLSRDMHDTITKNLHGLSLLSSGITRSLDRGRLDQARDTAELVGLTARQLADSSRAVILDLREQPDADLARALHDVVRGALAGHDLMLTWRVSDEAADGARTLDGDARREVLAVVGEAVHNVLKHAAAQSITVSGAREGDTLVLRVDDDGVGLRPEAAAAAAAGGHLGLVGAAERMQRLGGSAIASAASAGGTTVAIRVPLPDKKTRAFDRTGARPTGSAAIEGIAHG